MSEKTPEKQVESSTPEASSAASKPTAATGAESPRTAKELDFDDDVHDTLPVPDRQPTPKGTKRVSFQDDDAPAPPPKPPRPMSPKAQAEATLIEAFPSIDAKVVKAVLVASGGKVEPAFNALLSMSDPSFEHEPAPPPPPRKAMTQVEADALFARQLSEHYNSSYTGFGSRESGDPPLPPHRQETGLKPNEMYGDKEHSFFDDDLPVIKQNLQKGFEDTKTTINKWIKDFQKKIDGDESDDPIPRPGGPPQQRRQDYGPSTSNQLHGIRKSAEASRRSGEKDRYDADPQLLGDDFGHRLELRDDEAPPPRPPRPLANPDLFKTDAGSAGESATSAQAAKSATSKSQSAPSAGAGKAGGKWQPLTSLEPKAELEDHDPFSLGDSDDEPSEAVKKEAKAVESASPAAKKNDAAEASTATKEGEKSKAGDAEKS